MMDRLAYIYHYNQTLTLKVGQMRTQDKIVVGFVWCLIFFEGLSFLYLFASNLYT